MKIQKLRSQIDRLDKKLLQLLNDRLHLAEVIGRIKRESGQPVYAPEREEQLLANLLSLNRGPLTKSSLRSIYREILSASRSRQSPLRVAVDGQGLSISRMAAHYCFGDGAYYEGMNNLHEIFESVEEGNVDLGVFPIDALLETRIPMALIERLGCGVHLCGEAVMNGDPSGDGKFLLISGSPLDFSKRNRALIWMEEKHLEKAVDCLCKVITTHHLRLTTVHEGKRGKRGIRACLELTGDFTAGRLQKLYADLASRRFVYRVLGVYAAQVDE